MLSGDDDTNDPAEETLAAVQGRGMTLEGSPTSADDGVEAVGLQTSGARASSRHRTATKIFIQEEGLLAGQASGPGASVATHMSPRQPCRVDLDRRDGMGLPAETCRGNGRAVRRRVADSVPQPVSPPGGAISAPPARSSVEGIIDLDIVGPTQGRYAGLQAFIDGLPESRARAVVEKLYSDIRDCASKLAQGKVRHQSFARSMAHAFEHVDSILGSADAASSSLRTIIEAAKVDPFGAPGEPFFLSHFTAYAP